MGIAQAMENLAGEIRSATTARNAFLTNLRQDSKKHRQELRRQMNDLHNENWNKARELREKLTSKDRSRQGTAQQDTEQRRVAVSESRSNTQSLLNRSHLERIEAARQTMNDTRRAVNDICRATRSMLGEVAADLRGAHKAWAGVKKVVPEVMLEEPVQKERVLFAIQRHPEGTSIVDIGNELGVDWRSLTWVVQSLVEEREIERIDSMYYPGEKTAEEEIWR